MSSANELNARRGGIEHAKRAIIEKVKDELQDCAEYCRHQNGRPDCKNCGLDLGNLLVKLNNYEIK